MVCWDCFYIYFLLSFYFVYFFAVFFEELIINTANSRKYNKTLLT